jgi:glycosyltransferase involved in cell wall biosynthesis
MTDTTERPLVTFAVIAYNQERFIREAIEGAFAQTYQPLEIILSDDGSTDRTFDIMQEMAAAYDGPHRVRLNRNDTNLGLVPHIDRVMELVQGEFIVVNAGDDVSLPERAEKLATVWKSSPQEVKLVHSATTRIDSCGCALRYRAPSSEMQEDIEASEIIIKRLCVIGATAGWSCDVFSDFGPLGPNLLNEDHIIPFRAAILGRLEYIPEALVKHREGGVTAREQKNQAYEYLYGFSHKSRLWDYLVDIHILKNSCLYSYPRKTATEAVCRGRAPLLRFAVDIAESSGVHRWLALPHALRLALSHGSSRPLKDWARYTFELIYLPYANWRISRRLKTNSTFPETNA